MIGLTSQKENMPGVTKWIKRAAIVAGFIFCLLMFLVTATAFYLKTKHAQHLIQAKINQAIPGNISWDGFDISFFKGAIDVKNISIKDKVQKEHVHLRRLYLDIDLAKLIKNQLVIENVIIEAPEIILKVEKDGQIELVKAFYIPDTEKTSPPHEKTGRGFPARIMAKKFQFLDGLVRYETDTSFSRIHTGQLKLFGHYDIWGQKGDINVWSVNTLIENSDFKMTLSDVKCMADYHQGDINGIEIEAVTPSSTLSLKGNLVDLFHQPAFDLVLALNASLPEMASLFKVEPQFSGNARFDLTANGPLANPRATLMANYAGGDVLNRHISRMDMDLSLENKILSINKGHVNAFSGHLNLEGEIDFSKAFANGFLDSKNDLGEVIYRMSLKTEGLNAGEIIKGAKGTVSTGLALDGKGISSKTLSAQMNLEMLAQLFNPGNKEEFTDVKVNTRAELSKGIVRLERLDAVAGDAHIKGNGAFRVFNEGFKPNPTLPLTLQIDFSEIDASRFVDDDTLSGKINGHLAVKGSLDHLDVSLGLKGKDVAVKQVAVEDADARLSLSGGILYIDELNLVNRQSALEITGDARLLQPDGFKILDDPVFNIAAVSKGLFIEDFIEGTRGKFSLDAKAGGSVKHPLASIRLNGADMAFFEQKVASLEIDSELDGNRLDIRQLHVQVSEKESIEGEGWMSLAKEFGFAVNSRGISLKNLRAFQETGLDAGKMSFNVMGKGRFDDPEIEGDIGLSKLRFNNKDLQDISLSLDVRDQWVSVSGNPGFDFSGRYHLLDHTFSITSVLNNTDVSPYFKFADQPFWGGSVSGNIDFSGKAGSPESYRGLVDVSKLDLSFNDHRILEGTDINITMNGDEIFIPGIHLILAEKGYGDISGSIKLNGPMTLKAGIDIPVSMLSVFLEDVPDMSGDLKFEADIQGDMSKPELQGKIEMADIRGTLPYLNQQIHNINGRILMTPEMVNIETLSGQLDTGRFDLAGRVKLDQFQPVDMRFDLTASALPVKIPDTLDVILDAKLKLRGAPEKSAVNGEVTLIEGLYYKDVNLNFLNGALQKKREISAPPPSDPSVLDTMAPNIDLKYRNPFAVDNNLAVMNIVPDLKISGTAANPIMNGRADIRSGTVTYRKKEFIIKKGVVDFLNPYKIEPTIDISSEITVRDWLIQLGISGTPDEMAFKLSSDPPLDDGDILSLLLIGRTSKEMIAGEGGSSQSAQQMLAQALADVVGNEIKEVAGLDIVEAEMKGSSGNGSASDVKVTLGKELSRRMTVKYVMETKKGEMVQGAIAEYKFLEDILVSGFQDNQGSFGGAVTYRLEFR